jgi:hypothetical protein
MGKKRRAPLTSVMAKPRRQREPGAPDVTDDDLRISQQRREIRHIALASRIEVSSGVRDLQRNRGGEVAEKEGFQGSLFFNSSAGLSTLWVLRQRVPSKHHFSGLLRHFEPDRLAGLFWRTVARSTA